MQLLQGMLAPSILLAVVHLVPGNTTVVASQSPVHRNHAWPALPNTDQTAPLGNPNGEAGVLDVVLAETARDEFSVFDSLSPKWFR